MSLIADTKAVLESLNKPFKQRLQKRSLNTVVSLLSQFQEIDILPVGKQPLVKKILRGAYNVRPLPKHNFTCDIGVIIKLLLDFDTIFSTLMGQINVPPLAC